MTVPMLLAGLLRQNSLDGEQGIIEIKGAFNGDIKNGGEVHIFQNGSFEGRIQAKRVEIAGTVRGDIEAEYLVIHPSGRLYYNEIYYQDLKAEDGCTMIYNLKQEKTDGPAEGAVELKDKLIRLLDLDSGSNGADMESPKSSAYAEFLTDNIIEQQKQDESLSSQGAPPDDGQDKISLEGIAPKVQGVDRGSNLRRQPRFYSSY